MSERFFAPCPRGLEPALAAELALQGGEFVTVAEGGVAFSGPIGIGQIIVTTVFASGFIGLLSVLMAISLSLGVMNLLPIPMLDGGQIMVLGVEKVLSWFGKTLSMVAKERIQLTGLAIVLLLMVTVIFFDVSRLVSK